MPKTIVRTAQPANTALAIASSFSVVARTDGDNEFKAPSISPNDNKISRSVTTNNNTKNAEIGSDRMSEFDIVLTRGSCSTLLAFVPGAGKETVVRHRKAKATTGGSRCPA